MVSNKDFILPATPERQSSDLDHLSQRTVADPSQILNTNRSSHPTRPMSSRQCNLDASKSSNDTIAVSIATTAKTPSGEMGTTDLEATQADRTPRAIPVPRAQRRGIFGSGRFTILAEITEPKHYTNGKKWLITSVIAMAASAAPTGSSIILPSLPAISDEFHATPAVTNLATALYMLALGIFPLWWSSFSETSGRRSIYLVSFALFVIWNTLSALSVNIIMLIVLRILAGGAAASVQAVGAGTIADIWEPKERGNAMGIFYLGPLMGPLLGPIIGGALAQSFGWRSTQWFLAIFGGVILAMLFFVLPETLKIQSHPQDVYPVACSDEKARDHISSESSVSHRPYRSMGQAMKFAKRLFFDPLKIVAYLRFPAVFITVYYTSITFGCLYILNISLETTFGRAPYAFSTNMVGLTYIPNAVGYLLASKFGGKWSDRIMAREARSAGRYDSQGKLIYRPEDRMRENAWIAAFMFPTALIWYGWTAEKGVFWVAPLLANFFFGLGSMIVFGMTTTMLTEFMPRKASSGVAVSNLIRNVASCAGAILSEPAIDAIGNGFLFTIIGLIGFASSGVIWAMRRFGHRWREKMVEALG